MNMDNRSTECLYVGSGKKEKKSLCNDDGLIVKTVMNYSVFLSITINSRTRKKIKY